MGAVLYETTAQIVIDANAPTPGPVRAVTPGSIGNLVEGATLSFSLMPPQVDGAATVIEMDGGTDQETDDQLRARILQRIQGPPAGRRSGRLRDVGAHGAGRDSRLGDEQRASAPSRCDS